MSHRRIIAGQLLAGLTFFGLTTPAAAQPGGAHVAVVTGLERTDAASGTGARDGFYYGGQLGYDWDLGPVFAGVEGELGGSTARTVLGTDRARQGVFANAAVRLAVPVVKGVRVFARGGYAYHAIGYDTAPSFKGSGYVVGGGAEADLGKALFVRAEYRFSDYGDSVRGQHFLSSLGLRF